MPTAKSSEGPDEGNLTPKRQGHQPRALGPVSPARVGCPARGCLVEVIGARPFRAKAKRRKAYRMGKLAAGSEARSSSVIRCVLATGWSRSLLVLPEELCRIPRRTEGRSHGTL